MVDRARIETVEDLRKAIFSLTNLTLKLERTFHEWQEHAFESGGPVRQPHFVT